MILSFDDIKIKKKLILNKSSLSLHKNSITLIKGKNGTGKTLLLKRLFYEYNYINSTFIEQNSNYIFTDKNTIENILMFANDYNEVINFIKANNLTYLLDKNPKTLSGGEKRLIVLIRALFSENELIFIDEPTNDLDDRSVEIIIKLLNQIKNNKYLIINSHDDRIENISQNVYQIINYNLINEKYYNGVNDSYINKKINLDIKRKIIPFNYFLLILVLILISFLIPLVIMFNKNNQNKEIKDSFLEQIDLVSIGSSSHLVPGKLKYLLPKDVVNAFFTNNPFKIAKIITNMKNEYDFIKPAPIQLLSSANYKTYPIGLVNNKTKKIVSSIDLFTSYLGYDIFFTKIDTSEYFEYTKTNYIQIEKTILFDPIEYDLFITKLFKDNPGLYSIAYMIVRLNDGYKFDDFIKSTEFLNIDSNIAVYSNQIRFLIENNLVFKNNIKLFIMMLSTLLFFLFVNNLLVLLLIFLHKKNIIIYKNHNFNEEKIYIAIKDKLAPRFIYVIFIFSFLLFNIVINKGQAFLLFNYLPTYFVFILITLCYNLSNRISKLYMNKLLNWKYRCL